MANNDIGVTQFQISKVPIEFHHWMLKNDTIENADKYFQLVWILVLRLF